MFFLLLFFIIFFSLHCPRTKHDLTMCRPFRRSWDSVSRDLLVLHINMQVVVFLHIPCWELITMNPVEIVHFWFLTPTTLATMIWRRLWTVVGVGGKKPSIAGARISSYMISFTIYYFHRGPTWFNYSSLRMWTSIFTFWTPLDRKEPSILTKLLSMKNAGFKSKWG